MRHLVHVVTPLLLSLALVSGPAPTASAAEAKAKHYICVPCGLPCDSKVFDKPGTCPQCGMKLVDQESPEAVAKPAKKVAILIFDGVEIIDYTGPWEVFGAAGLDVYTVAATKTPITTAMGMAVVPKYTFADAPQPDLLVVPGGGVKATMGSAPTLQWIRDVTGRAEHTMSVCNGAFILASAGLLDGLTATTTSGNIDRLRATFPKIHVVDDQRFVDNGKVVTAAGLTAGIDGALHMVSVMLGNGMAQQVALGEEYDWHPGAEFARAALADRLIPAPDLDSVGKWDIVSTEGGKDHWELVVRGTSDLSAEAVMDHVGKAFASKGKWVRVGPAGAGDATATRSDWKFSGRDGRPWTGTLTIEGDPGKSHEYTARLSIARAG